MYNILLIFNILSALCFTDDNKTTDINMELFPTYNAVGVDVSYSGDANKNLNAVFYYRIKGQQDWLDGLEMTMTPEFKRIYASAFRFAQNQTVEVKVEFSDPD